MVSRVERCNRNLYNITIIPLVQRDALSSCSKFPPNRPKDAFYFMPLAKPTPTCWYSCKGTVACLSWNTRISHKPLSTCDSSHKTVQCRCRQTTGDGTHRSSQFGWSLKIQTHVRKFYLIYFTHRERTIILPLVVF